MVHLVRRSGTTTLAGAMALAAAAAAVALAQRQFAAGQPGGDAAIGLACAATLPGFLLGWFVSRQPFSTAAMGAAAGLAGILIRMVVPLAAIGWASIRPPDAATVAPAGYVLGAYLALLATDIGLHLALRREPLRPSPSPPRSGEESRAD
ncbi:MAG: hypothetical protein KGQ61_12980 [Planctomycetes bacterium]|nr:hypothetical protein [Planctomycetota bacterium]